MTADQIKNCSTLQLQLIKDKRDGAIAVAEAGRQIPFEFRRVYYITGINDPATVRGGHAHHALKQALLCASGGFRLDLDDGEHKASVQVEAPEAGVYVGPHVWHTLTDFKPGTVVVVLASDVYEEADYIRDYDEFLRVVKAGA